MGPVDSGSYDSRVDVAAGSDLADGTSGGETVIEALRRRPLPPVGRICSDRRPDRRWSFWRSRVDWSRG